MKKEKRRPGRPRKNYTFRCGPYPHLNVLIPAWQENERLKENPTVQFYGGLVDTGIVTKQRNLSEEETEQMIEVLKDTRHVYVADDLSGESYTCGYCGGVYKKRSDLEFHLVHKHSEDMGISGPNRTPWDPYKNVTEV